MAIDRTNYNALVDDDGSGAVGTIWNKNQLKICVLDPIDTEITDVTNWTPSWGGSGGQTGQVYSLQAGRYTLVNKTVYFWGHMTLTTLGTITGALIVNGLPLTTNGTSQPAVMFAYFTGLTTSVASLFGIISVAATNFAVYYLPAAGATAVTGGVQGTLSNTTDAYFSGWYHL